MSEEKKQKLIEYIYIKKRRKKSRDKKVSIWKINIIVWVFFIVTNFQIWVYKENVCPFIPMVLSYNYKFLKMGIRRKCVSSFCLRFRLSCLSISI